jgi:hypothetical protein
MLPASTLWEAAIPTPATDEPMLAPESAAAATLAALGVALRALLRLAFYLATMRLLGYRIRREAAPRAARPSRPRPAGPAIPPQPRRKHLYIDRDMCLGVLAGIDAAFAAALPAPVGASTPVAAAKSLPRPPRAIRRPRAAAPRTARVSPHTIRLKPRPHPPPASKRQAIAPPTRAHFVTIP